MAKNTYHYGIGRRKEATATARLSAGKGDILINQMPAAEYLGVDDYIENLTRPLRAVNYAEKFDVSIKVSGGGKSGQSDAAKLAIAKALTAFDESLRPTLKKAGFIKRDARVKERKKYGLKRARKAPQFTKR